MAQKKLRTARATGAVLGVSLSSSDCSSEYNPSFHPRQADFDAIGLLAARSRVASATIRAQFDAWRIGGAQ